MEVLVGTFCLIGIFIMGGILGELIHKDIAKEAKAKRTVCEQSLPRDRECEMVYVVKGVE